MQSPNSTSNGFKAFLIPSCKCAVCERRPAKSKRSLLDTLSRSLREPNRTEQITEWLETVRNWLHIGGERDNHSRKLRWKASFPIEGFSASQVQIKAATRAILVSYPTEQPHSEHTIIIPEDVIRSTVAYELDTGGRLVVYGQRRPTWRRSFECDGFKPWEVDVSVCSKTAGQHVLVMHAEHKERTASKPVGRPLRQELLIPPTVDTSSLRLRFDDGILHVHGSYDSYSC